MTATNLPAIGRVDQPYPAAPGGFTQVVGSSVAELCDRHSLSLGAQGLLLRLLLAADRRTESVGYYTQGSWAEYLGVSRNHLAKLQRELEAAGCISVVHSPGSHRAIVLLSCWAEVVHQPAERTTRGGPAHSVRSTCPPGGEHLPTGWAGQQGFRAPRDREIDTAPKRSASSASPGAPVVDLVLEILPTTSRREAERWVGERIGAGFGTEQLQLALEDARSAGNVRYLSWVDKRLGRYQAEGAGTHPADRPTQVVWCSTCYEQQGVPISVAECGCTNAEVLELRSVAS